MEPNKPHVYVPDASEPPALGQVGGKALGLYRLRQVACEVPAWFVITVAAWRTSREGGTRTAGAVPTEPDRLEPAPAVMEDVEAAMQLLGMTECDLAVRSSARGEDGGAHSFAGQFASVLHVRSSELPSAIARVWASADSDHCREYARQNRVSPEDLVPAVVVQRMVVPDCAGVMFTADPVSGEFDRTTIAAIHGLGEGIVSGACNGDTYCVDDSGVIVKRDIAHKTRCVQFDPGRQEVRLVPVPETLRDTQVCPDDVVVRLAALGGTIESALGAPQDIEWCLEGERIHILQARPISSLGRKDRIVRIWDNANVVESYPGVTLPLTFSFVEPIYGEVYHRLFRQFGLSERHLERQGASFRMLGFYRGKIYYNLLNWYRNLGLLPGANRHLRNFNEMLGTGAGLDSADLPRPQPPGPTRTAWIAMRLTGRFFLQPWTINRFMKRVRETREAADAIDLKGLRLDELVHQYERHESLLVRHWTTPQFNDFYCQTATGLLKSAIARWLGDGFTVAMHELLPMDESVESERAVESLCDLAAAVRGRPALVDACRGGIPSRVLALIGADEVIGPRFDAHVRKYGDRWHGELKLETVTPREDPEVLVGVLAQHVLTPPRMRSGGTVSALPEAIGRLSRWKRACLAILVRLSRRLIAARENTRFERTRMFGLVRRGFREMGRKLAMRGHLAAADDVFYLTKDEVFGFIEGIGVDADLRRLVDARRSAAADWRQFPGPGTFRSDGLLAEVVATEADGTSTERQEMLSGIGASPGVVRGRLRLIRSPEELDGARGCIIATESTDPGWSFIFPLISGILVERGSMLSHAAIVAREMGIPAVVGIDRLMDRLEDGCLVELDGSAGTARVVEG